MSDKRKIRNDIVAVALLTVIVFLVACLATYDKADPVSQAFPAFNQFYQPDQLVYPQNESFTNACGRIGAWTADLLVHVLGVGAYLLVVGLISLEIALFRQTMVKAPKQVVFSRQNPNSCCKPQTCCDRAAPRPGQRSDEPSSIQNGTPASSVHRSKELLAGQMMPQLVPFGRKVGDIVFVARRQDGNLIDHFQLESSQVERLAFFWIIR